MSVLCVWLFRKKQMRFGWKERSDQTVLVGQIKPPKRQRKFPKYD